MSELVVKALAISLLSGGAMGACSCIWQNPMLTPALQRYGLRLAEQLAFLRYKPCARECVALQLLAIPTLVTCAFIFRPELPLMAAVIVAVLPSLWLNRARMRRIAQLETQLDPWFVTLANALRGVPALGEALASTTAMTSAPLREELELLLREQALGLRLDQALQRASLRVRSRALTAALLTLRVARASGGNVSACLESSAATLREMIRLEGVLRAKTAEGKMQALVISVMPLPFFVLLHWLDPGFLAPLLGTLRGQLILTVAGSLWMSGVLLARRIVAAEL